jgi:DNA-binding response OmpR family regulator
MTTSMGAASAMRVLIVDDEEMIRELVRATLSTDGRFELSEAADGESALTAVAESLLDLVILDVRMPGIDGVETCQRIRSQHGAQGPKVLMLTALGQDSDVRRYTEAGADGYFIKPFSPRELLTQVHDLFGWAA